ncbi:hypothetical protein [Cohnella sp. WQ 127256]|uniref:hypothetical protein n=1 Tax=Cohnella sp. WQ 127256 TaxID=2938790 RepID=UPI0021196D6C|nr:hypothetical protein [Cohnella sp. WQ 127256]
MIDPSNQPLWVKKVMIWVGAILCGLLTMAGTIGGDWEMALIGGGSTVLCIAGLVFLHRQHTAPSTYRPGKGFWFHRLTPRRKNRVLTIGQVAILLLIIGNIWSGDVNLYMIGYSLGGIALLQFMVKPRIKLHAPVDDAALFELEDLGIIRPDELVVGMYKDFQSWNTVNAGAKLLLLTPARLIAIRMLTPEEGERKDIQLMDIDRLGLIGHGKKGLGLILSVGLTDDSIIRFMLLGQSYKYSPEQFIQQLLELLDKRPSRQGEVQDSIPSLRVRPDGHSPVSHQYNLVFRPLDLHKESTAPASNSPQQLSVSQQKALDF